MTSAIVFFFLHLVRNFLRLMSCEGEKSAQIGLEIVRFDLPDLSSQHDEYQTAINPHFPHH
jgi:hypothetical protein